MKRKIEGLSKENPQELNLATLPKNVLTSIFTFFTNKELRRLTRVCKSFNQVINQGDVYRHKAITMSNPGKNAKAIARANVQQLKEHTTNIEKAAGRYLQDLISQPNWWPDLTAEAADYLLLSNEAEIGSFIYRKSSQGNSFFCLSQVKTAKPDKNDSNSFSKPIKSTGALTVNLSGYSSAKKPRTVDPEELDQLRIDSKAQGREVVHFRFEIRPGKQYQLEKSDYRIFNVRYNENSKIESYGSFEELKNHIGGKPFINPENNAVYNRWNGL